jgi:peptidoglycan/LPS O-acetylase OafA/YrhL
MSIRIVKQFTLASWSNCMRLSTNERIVTIDGFRCLAVMAVVVYHYYWRYASPANPENYLSESYSIFRYGYYGVQFFFVISGFIISHTLLSCDHFGDFIFRRLIRLLPALVVCAVITYVATWFYGGHLYESHRSILNFLPSLTFTPPQLWQQWLNRVDIAYIDDVYWSLSVEMMFYFLAGAIFFLSRQRFVSTLLLVTATAVLIRIATSPKLHDGMPSFLHPFTDSVYHLYLILNFSYWIYFALGVFFYKVFSEGIERISLRDKILIGFLVATEYYFLADMVLMVLFTLIMALFLVFIYRQRWLIFLQHRVIVLIGVISYPVYLLHHNIGFILMNVMSGSFESVGPLVPAMIMFLIFGLAFLIFYVIERPAIRFLRAWLTRSSAELPESRI